MYRGKPGEPDFIIMYYSPLELPAFAIAYDEQGGEEYFYSRFGVSLYQDAQDHGYIFLSKEIISEIPEDPDYLSYRDGVPWAETKEERLEIADGMIERWKEYRESING